MQNTEQQSEQTKARIRAAFQMTAAIAETIRELGEVPAGVMYGHLAGRLSLEVFEGVVRTLVNAKLVTKRGDVLVWRGPLKGVK